MHNHRSLRGILTGGFILLGVVAAAAQSGDLVGMLTSNLGVSADQAVGGAGAIFQVAKQNLSASEFSQVAGAVPEMDRLLEAAPAVAGSSGGGSMLGSAAAMLGGGGSSLSSLTGLAGSFSKLGMDGNMVSRFLPLVLQYVKGNGGNAVMQLLQGALQ